MSAETLLHLQNLTKTFKSSGRRRVQALRGVSIELGVGETLGVVGESGSGKSTLGRGALGLLKLDGGTVKFDGMDLTRPQDFRLKRQEMQMIFQDPSAALVPRMTVERNIEDPLIIHRKGSREERLKRVYDLLKRVGLDAAYGQAYPRELSGGQQQRVMIARALALDPKFVVCDEVLSALDVSIQAQIISLLQELQKDLGLSYLFISHNLAAVARMSHYIAVMYLGEIVEVGPTKEIVQNPRHPYTANLVKSVLQVPSSRSERSLPDLLPGEIPSPSNIPVGCSFHTRCPHATAICREQAPQMSQIGERHQAACHLIKESSAI